MSSIAAVTLVAGSLRAEKPLVLSGPSGVDTVSDVTRPRVYAAREMPHLFDPVREIGVEVTLFAENLRESVTVRIPTDPDRISDELVAKLENLLRCYRTGRRRRIDRRLLAAIGTVAARYHGHEIVVVSGYRAPPYGVPHSRHFRGQALDFRVRGVPLHEVRDYLWETFDHVGVGQYLEQSFIHLDVRPGKPKIGWVQRHMGEDYRYHPRWADPSV